MNAPRDLSTAILVQFVGPVRRPGPERSLSIDPTGLTTIGDLLGRLGYAAHEIAVLTVLAGGVRLTPDSPLSGVTSIEILLAIGGG